MVTDIIWSVRSQRSRAVQNEEQYLYIHYLTIQRFVNKGIVSDKAVSSKFKNFNFAKKHFETKNFILGKFFPTTIINSIFLK